MFCTGIHIYTSDTSERLERGGKSEKSWLCSFARVTWWVVGCIVCWTCFIAFVGRLTEHTQCGARPRRPQTGSVLVENTLWVYGSSQHHHYATLASVHLIWAFLTKIFGICSAVATAATKKEGSVLKFLFYPLQWNRTLFPGAPSTNTVSHRQHHISAISLSSSSVFVTEFLFFVSLLAFLLLEARRSKVLCWIEDPLNACCWLAGSHLPMQETEGR